LEYFKITEEELKKEKFEDTEIKLINSLINKELRLKELEKFLNTLHNSDLAKKIMDFVEKISKRKRDSLSRNIVGVIGGYYFTNDYKVIPMKEDREIWGINPEHLQDMVKKNIRVIGVASGLNKVEALKIAVLGGFINMLITDEMTAIQMLK